MLPEKAMLFFPSLKIPFLWELSAEFTGIVSHVLEPAGPFACVRKATLGESSSYFGTFLHIYPCTLFCESALLLLLVPLLESFHHGPDDAFQASCTHSR